MAQTSRASREPVADDTSEPIEFRNDVAALYFRGVERMAEVEKQFIDLAAEQNKEMGELIKKAAARLPGAPRIPLFELSYSAVNRFADVQKAAVDFIVDQNRIMIDLFKGRTDVVSKAGEMATNAAKQLMERSIAVQKKALDHTAAHTKAMVDATRNQWGLSGSQADAMTDSFRRGVDTIVEAQKELLNMVTH